MSTHVRHFYLGKTLRWTEYLHLLLILGHLTDQEQVDNELFICLFIYLESEALLINVICI